MTMRLGLRKELALAFAAMLLLQAALGLVARAALDRVGARFSLVAVNSLPSVAAIDDVTIQLGELRQLELRHFMTSSAAERRRLEAEMRPLEVGIDATLEHYAPLVAGVRDGELYRQSQAQWRDPP